LGLSGPDEIAVSAELTVDRGRTGVTDDGAGAAADF